MQFLDILIVSNLQILPLRDHLQLKQGLRLNVKMNAVKNVNVTSRPSSTKTRIKTYCGVLFICNFLTSSRPSSTKTRITRAENYIN